MTLFAVCWREQAAALAVLAQNQFPVVANGRMTKRRPTSPGDDRFRKLFLLATTILSAAQAPVILFLSSMNFLLCF